MPFSGHPRSRDSAELIPWPCLPQKEGKGKDTEGVVEEAADRPLLSTAQPQKKQHKYLGLPPQTPDILKPTPWTWGNPGEGGNNAANWEVRDHWAETRKGRAWSFTLPGSYNLEMISMEGSGTEQGHNSQTPARLMLLCAGLPLSQGLVEKWDPERQMA